MAGVPLDPSEIRERWHRTRWVPPRRLDRLEDLAQAWGGAIQRALDDGKQPGVRRANLSALRSLLDSFNTLVSFRADVPQLCAEVERLRHEVKCLKEELSDARKEVEATDRALQRAIGLSAAD
jgi:hypothetical protein